MTVVPFACLNVLSNLILLGLEYLIILTIHFAPGMNSSLLLTIILRIVKLSSRGFSLTSYRYHSSL